ncbi:hypothetical protein H6F42_00460 [Pseudanabaena sp. FACHB-1998]|uniref:hypothetical protein n=1 Tax=Pseudanabaena sp. FACHB-1998 TaxID=2692858 RepID=UPI0016817C49|nr:hypothetical protein [Pseudanabaena sp. FACHB-1998]MBD2175384.1 hypothetical protein [Pseudanabaena sp. FACHB-1998]
MSKINQPIQSDDSNSKPLTRSVTPKPPIKDLPKLEVVKVIAPKSAETIQAEEMKVAKIDEQVKTVSKSVSVTAKVKTQVVNRVIESKEAPEPVEDDKDKVCLQPIPPATEPLQYRAIGVIYGRYIANEDNFAKGHILTTDGSQVDAVLLGKIISIVKKRLQSDREYLWVVYPRTNDKAGKLHVQIAGVWAPVELGKADIQVDPNVQDGYFSVRGEISSQSVEDNSVIVKVRRTEQKFDKQKDKVAKEYSKFKVRLTGLLPDDAIGQFWSVNVQRHGDVLTIIDGEFIGHVPYKGKRRPQSKGRVGGGGKFAPRKYGDRPYSDRPYKPSIAGDMNDGGIYPPRPKFSSTEDRPPVPRPLIKRKNPTE